MASKRKPTNENDSSAPAVAADTTRVTRSATRNATVTPPAAEPEPPRGKKAKTSAPAEKQERKAKPPPSAAEQEPASEPKIPDGSKTIIVEHCKQCHQFKKRAILVKDGLEKEVEGINVVLNPEKPRRGCFEIREKGGEIFISLLDMKRPFSPMRALDMDEVISDIVEKVK